MLVTALPMLLLLMGGYAMAADASVAAMKPNETVVTAKAATAAPKAEEAMAVKSEPTMSAATNQAAPKSTESTGSKVAFWINLLTPVILGVFGVIIKLFLSKYLKDAKFQKVMLHIRDGVKAFWQYSQGTDAEWDDAVAKLLLDLSDLLVAQGSEPLTDDQKVQYKTVAEKQKSILGPDKNPEEKVA
jgi:NADH:ubiquinone oxidoreductase subunit 5 (subunit L)/multisubunit Na+/H+ antiporter MnhA subunit